MQKGTPSRETTRGRGSGTRRRSPLTAAGSPTGSLPSSPNSTITASADLYAKVNTQRAYRPFEAPTRRPDTRERDRSRLPAAPMRPFNVILGRGRPGQPVRLGRNAALDLHLAAQGKQPWQVDRLLNVKAGTPAGWSGTGMPHRLEMSAHDAVRHYGVHLLASTIPGMIVCIGRLPGAIQFGCPRCSRKPKPRFCNITPDRSDSIAGTESLEQRVDETARVAVFIDDTQIDRILCGGINDSPAAGSRRIARSSWISTRNPAR